MYRFLLFVSLTTLATSTFAEGYANSFVIVADSSETLELPIVVERIPSEESATMCQLTYKISAREFTGYVSPIEESVVNIELAPGESFQVTTHQFDLSLLDNGPGTFVVSFEEICRTGPCKVSEQPALGRLKATATGETHAAIAVPNFIAYRNKSRVATACPY